MKCLKCQGENPDDARFCIACGALAEVQCPKCGAITPARGRFCKDCAHDLQAAPTPQAIDYTRPQTYTPKFLADKILSSGKSLEGERKLVTVLFADVANYTAMSEKLDEEEVHQIMDGCFKVALDEIHRYEGTIDKFTGDGAMALFGAPVAHEDHAQRACYAALGMVMGKAYPSQIAEAEGLILDGIRMLEELKVKPYHAEGYLYLGELYADAGQKRKALKSLGNARAMFQEMGMDYWLARTEKVLRNLEGTGSQ